MTSEQEILSAYSENPKGIYSINEIAKRLGKAYPHVHKTVRMLIDKGVLKRHEVGRSHLCSINFEDKRAILLLALNHTSKYETLPEDVKQRAAELLHVPHDIIVYHETKKRLYTVGGTTPTHTLHAQELLDMLLADEDFYANHTVLSGYENFYALINHPHITRRYHPFL